MSEQARRSCLLIDRHERIEKSAILDRLLAARIERTSTVSGFWPWAPPSIGELLLVKRAAEIGVVQGPEEGIWDVARTGLATVDVTGAPVGRGIRVMGDVNQLGEDMVEFGLAGLLDDETAGAAGFS